MSTEPLRSSMVAKIDPKYRLYHKAKTLMASLERRRHWLIENHHIPSEPSQHYTEVQVDLRHFTSQIIHLSSQLDIYTIIQDTAPKWVHMTAREVHDFAFPGCPAIKAAQITEIEQAVLDDMAQTSRDALASVHARDLEHEIAFRVHQGWYMVFGTLTVSPDDYSTVFDRGSLCWQTYIDKVDNRIAKATYGSVRKAKQMQLDYHTYFACVERGSKNGRLHIHVLHLIKELPEGTTDPNYGRLIPSQRQITTLRECWPHGHSTHIAVRTGNNDAFARQKWRWPVDKTTNQAIVSKGPMAVAGYITKYVTKQLNQTDREKYVWRVRKSRSLGRDIIRQLLSNLTNDHLMMMASNPTIRIKINNRYHPTSVIQEEAFRSLSARLSMTNRFALGLESHSLPSQLQRLRDLTRETNVSNSRNTGPSQIQTSKSGDIFNVNETLCELQTRFDEIYFPQSSVNGTKLSVRTA